jgi:hypothetical protein
MSGQKKLPVLADGKPPVTVMDVTFRLQLAADGEVTRVQIRKQSTAGVDVDILLTEEQALTLASMIRTKFRLPRIQ